MAVEDLEIVIDVIDRFTRELDQLLLKLSEVEAVARGVDRINIRVDVDDAQLDALIAKMAATRGGGAVFTGGGGGRGGAGGTLALAAGELDIAESVDQATDSMRTFSRTVDQAEDNSGLFNLRMSTLHNALAKLIPLILVIIGALPALITAVVALTAAAIAAAAALAAITGFGALGFALMEGGRGQLGEGLQEALSQVVDDFIDAFEPLAIFMEPLFRDLIDGLDMLFEAVANRGDALAQLTDDARAFGGFLLDFIPDMLENMARMAEAFGPLFGMFADFIGQRSFLAFLTTFMADALPAFLRFLDVLIQVLPTLLQISIGFLDVTAALIRVIDWIGQVIGILGISEEAFGILIATLLATVTAVNLLSLSGLRNLAIWFATLVPRILMSIGVLDVYTGSTLAAALATSTLAFAAAALVGILTLGLGLVAAGAAAEFMADKFFGASAGIKSATNNLREFDRVSRRTGGPGPNVRSGSLGGDRFTGGFSPMGGSVTVNNFNVDNRGRSREDSEAQVDRAMWKAKKQSGNKTT